MKPKMKRIRYRIFFPLLINRDRAHMSVLFSDCRDSGNSLSDLFVPRWHDVKDNPPDAAFDDRADRGFCLKALIQRELRDTHYNNSADGTYCRPVPADRRQTCDCCTRSKCARRVHR